MVAIFVTPSRNTPGTTVHATDNTASEMSDKDGTKFIRLLLQPYPLRPDLLVLYFNNTSLVTVKTTKVPNLAVTSFHL